MTDLAPSTRSRSAVPWLILGVLALALLPGCNPFQPISDFIIDTFTTVAEALD